MTKIDRARAGALQFTSDELGLLDKHSALPFNVIVQQLGDTGMKHRVRKVFDAVANDSDLQGDTFGERVRAVLGS